MWVYAEPLAPFRVRGLDGAKLNKSLSRSPARLLAALVDRLS